MSLRVTHVFFKDRIEEANSIERQSVWGGRRCWEASSVCCSRGADVTFMLPRVTRWYWNTTMAWLPKLIIPNILQATFCWSVGPMNWELMGSMNMRRTNTQLNLFLSRVKPNWYCPQTFSTFWTPTWQTMILLLAQKALFNNAINAYILSLGQKNWKVGWT